VLVGDTIIYLTVLLLSLFFTYAAFDQPTEIPRPGSAEREPARHGEILAMLRASAFPFFAWICWVSLAFMTSQMNNCSFSFSACFTSPTYLTTTAKIIPASYDGPLYILFMGLGWTMFMIGWVISAYLWLPADRMPERIRNLWGKGK
jgi:hypothetical protein